MTKEPIGPVGPSMMCERCGCRLNNYEQWKGKTLVKITWEHTGLMPEGMEEHEPVPVLLDANEMPRVGWCDFCNSDKPEWGFPCAPFQIAVTERPIETGGTESLGWGSDDNWAACQECRDDIETGRWEAIETRFLTHKAVPKHLRSDLLTQVQALHRQFRLGRLGPPYKTVRQGST